MSSTGAPRRGRVLVLQHHPDENLGALGPLLEDAGLTATVCELDAGDRVPTLETFDLMIAMGGPQHVWQESEHPWLVQEKDSIRRWVVDLGRPFLGVCLGHQLLADAMGGQVIYMDTPEIGVLDVVRTEAGATDPLFGRLPAVVPGLQWHEAEVVLAPHEARVLAQSAQSPIQALRVGPRAIGVQFHVEVSAETIAKWAVVPEYERTLALHFGDAATLERTVERHLETMTSVAATLVDALVEDVLDTSMVS